MGPIRPEKIIEGDLDFGYSAGYAEIIGLGCVTRNAALKPCLVGTEISTCQLMVEEQLDVGSPLQFI